MQRVRFMPSHLNRALAPERLANSVARVLQRIDCTFRKGSLISGYGAARTQTTAPASTVTSCYAVHTNGGKMIAVDSANGTIRMTPGDGTLATGGPLNMWADARSVET